MKNTPSIATIAESLVQYGIRPTSQQLDQVNVYISLLLRWNRAISLTSVTDASEIVRFHFGESAFALSCVPGMNGRLADVGTGAGFPGLPLRIFGRDLELTLIEANAKKCAFLFEVVRELGLGNVHIIRARYEEAVVRQPSKPEVVTSRALSGQEELLRWAASSLAPNGKIVLWLSENDARVLAKTPGFDWATPVAIPGSRRRCILFGHT